MKQPKDLASFLHRLLLWTLLFKLLGYFTLTENIAITRVLKIILRLGSTALIIWPLFKLKDIAQARFHFKEKFSYIMYLMYFLLAFASILWSSKPSYSGLQWFMNIESLVFAFFYIQVLQCSQQLYPKSTWTFPKYLFRSILMILVVFTALGLIFPDTFMRATHGGEIHRLGGYLMNPNELGMLTVVGAACLIFVEMKAMHRWLLLGFLIYVLLLTSSRSSLIGLGLVLVLNFTRMVKPVWRVPAIFAGIFGMFWMVSKIFLKMGDMSEVMDLTGRLPFWTALLNEGFPKSPWFGFGYMRIAENDAFKGLLTYAGQMTHNTFLQVLMNLGMVGFAIMVLQMLFFGIAVKQYENWKLITSIFIALFINSCTEFGIFGESNYGILLYQLLLVILSFQFVIGAVPENRKTLESEGLVTRAVFKVSDYQAIMNKR